MTRIYLIRHGQTTWNVEGRWQGALDIPLGEVGHEQARALAKHLKDRPIAAIYSSDLARAYATAEPLAQAKGITIQTDARLREINFGVFQGLTHEEIRLKYPAEERELMTNYLEFVVPEGESRRMMQDRAYEAWQEAVRQYPEGEVVLMSHGGPVRLLLMKLFPQQVERMMRVPVPNVSISTILAEGDMLILEGLSEVAHLAGIGHPDTHSP